MISRGYNGQITVDWNPSDEPAEFNLHHNSLAIIDSYFNEKMPNDHRAHYSKRWWVSGRGSKSYLTTDDVRKGDCINSLSPFKRNPYPIKKINNVWKIDFENPRQKSQKWTFPEELTTFPCSENWAYDYFVIIKKREEYAMRMVENLKPYSLYYQIEKLTKKVEALQQGTSPSPPSTELIETNIKSGQKDNIGLKSVNIELKDLMNLYNVGYSDGTSGKSCSPPSLDYLLKL